MSRCIFPLHLFLALCLVVLAIPLNNGFAATLHDDVGSADQVSSWQSTLLLDESPIDHDDDVVNEDTEDADRDVELELPENNSKKKSIPTAGTANTTHSSSTTRATSITHCSCKPGSSSWEHFLVC